jgi:pimeloyl-ACP methyl ester carboxylesterase
MSLSRHCTAAALLVMTAVAASAQQRPFTSPQPGDASFIVFLKGTEAGQIQVHLARTSSNWVITSTGKFGDLTINRFELKYSLDWQPAELRVEATQGQRPLQLATSFGMTTAISEITQNGATSAKTDQITARTVVLPNNFFAAFEGLAARLVTLDVGADVPIYVAPQAEVRLTIKSIDEEAVQTPAGTVQTRRYDVAIQNVGATIDATVTVDDKSRLARLQIPVAGLMVVRSDLGGVAARTQTARNPGDSDVTIPANGFNIAGTLTTPSGGVGRLRHPTVVLVAGSGAVDRDETVAGIPVFSQLAGQLAEQGFLVLRYDKRGVGQSGGRTETVTYTDYADDLIAIVKWLSKRDDVDPRRIAVAGHSEGAAVAMLAAARDGKITSLVLIASPGTTGAELILEQQRHQLDVMKVPEQERQDKIALQKRIQEAVITEKGWEALPPDVRRAAETPMFRSLLMFDPAQVMPRIKQPILIVQGDLDVQVPPHHADRLGDLAHRRKKAGPVEVVHLPGVNHILVPATTGEVAEYPELKEKTISPDVAKTIAQWLRR